MWVSMWEMGRFYTSQPVTAIVQVFILTTVTLKVKEGFTLFALMFPNLFNLTLSTCEEKNMLKDYNHIKVLLTLLRASLILVSAMSILISLNEHDTLATLITLVVNAELCLDTWKSLEDIPDR